jgi:hypothetical protein
MPEQVRCRPGSVNGGSKPARLGGGPIAVENVRIHVAAVRPNDGAELAVDGDLAEGDKIAERLENGTPKLWLEHEPERPRGEEAAQDVQLPDHDCRLVLAVVRSRITLALAVSEE